MFMILIGDVGIIDDRVMSLYQCPKCKGVKITKWIDGVPKCDCCRGIK